MPLETITIPVTDRASWLDMRRQDVTASDVGAVFGLHPHKTPLQLWAEKTGVGLDTVENAAMRRGRWMEDAVIAACRDYHPDWTIEKPGVYVRAPAYRIGATPDAVANGSIVVQCKTVAAQAFKGWDDGPPAHYQLQALTEALLLDAERAVLAVLVVSPYGADYKEFDVPRHEAAEARILTGVPDFWKAISEGRTPAADYAADADILAKLHAPDDNLPPIDLSSDNYLGALLEERERLDRDSKEIEDRLKQIKGEIVEKLKGHTAASAPGWFITNKIQHRREMVVKASSFAVLRVKRTEEKVA